MNHQELLTNITVEKFNGLYKQEKNFANINYHYTSLYAEIGDIAFEPLTEKTIGWLLDFIKNNKEESIVFDINGYTHYITKYFYFRKYYKGKTEYFLIIKNNVIKDINELVRQFGINDKKLIVNKIDYLLSKEFKQIEYVN